MNEADDGVGFLVVASGPRVRRRSRAALELDDRLVDDTELAAIHGEPPVRLELQAIEQRRVHLRLEDGVTAFAQILGAVHRHVGVSKELVDALGAVRIRDADARAHRHFAALDAQRESKRVGDALHHEDCIVVVLHAFQKNGEFVATDSRYGIAAARRFEQPLADRHEPSIAFRVAERVVHRLTAAMPV